MSLKQGRLGLLGLGIESTAGIVVPATTTIPFITNTLEGKHEIQKDIAARGSRASNFTSVVGKQWGEGDVEVNVDLLNIGFFLKLATGTENVNTIVSSQVFDHVFYTTVSGNSPLTASVYNYQGVDTQVYASVATDKLELSIKDAFMTAKSTLKGFFPTSGSFAATTVSGTLINFDNYKIQLGANLVAAAVASKTAISNFTVTINNNVEVVFESGQSTPTRVFYKQLEVLGEFTQFFETATQRDNYYNLNKQSLIITASGMALPSGNVEQMTINLAKLVYTDVKIDTGLENFFAVKTSFIAEVDVLQGKQYDIVLRNYRATTYT